MVVLTSFPPPTDGIRHQQPSTTVYVNNRELGKGTLFIAESRLAWVNSATDKGFSLEYPHIALHAVSRDLQAHPYECIYVMIDTCLEEQENGDKSDEDDEEDGPGVTEMHFVPDDKGVLDAMFSAMSHCQSLHPDLQESFSEDDDQYEDADSEGEYIIGNGTNSITSNYYNQRQNGSRIAEEAMDVEEGQFEDADDQPE